ncbi:unnamed protein product [Owenia fusiformis]|uniref:Uncharacterized protein n=1 Tax=Owenia fusiformis TaxID=6347 RepID=A0A8J1U632_OWEFU|nr:unnamed protein product [Owenia fusiformis]
MYDRAERKFGHPKGSTGMTVGPGTYDADLPTPAKIKSDGYAPFASMTNRETFFNIGDQVIAAPGPGQYDPGFAQDAIRGGKTLGNKEKRFKESATFTPGPGMYNMRTELGTNSAPSRLQSQNGKNGGALMANRVKFQRKPDAPSIPFPGQSYGFEENEDGTLKKQDPPNKDKSMGPAFYNPAQEDTRTTKTYKGVHFGKLSSKRMDFNGKVGPGPGDYEAFSKEVVAPENVNINGTGGSKRYDAKLPRYHEWVVNQEEKKAVPGPGKYEVKGVFDPSPPKVNTEGIEVEHPPFLSQSKRFNPGKSAGPAPGTYNDPRHALEGLKRITGLKRSPFGQTSTRFDGEHHVKKTPGPGTYNAPGMGSESMRRAYIESTRRGVFGTTAIRINPITKKEENDLPGPSHYQPKEKPFKSRYEQLNANFASLSSRLTEQPTIVKEVPPPGAYEVNESYQNSQAKKTTGKPRTKEAANKQGAFLQSASRFVPPRDVINETSDPANPGPGSYDFDSRLNKKGGLMVTKDNRFKEKINDMPGPGTYEYSPLIQDTVLKGTFNATLNNPVAPKVEVSQAAAATGPHAFLLGT